MNNFSNIIRQFWKKYRTIIFWSISIIIFSFSFIQYHTSGDDINAKTKKLQRKYSHREKILEDYVDRTLKTPVDEWIKFDNFPEDMVIYRYNEDTLQSWVNLFPISNDEVDLIPLWYRIHDMNSRNLFNTPLAYITNHEQYVNLGSYWYVVKVYVKGRTKVISGLLIKKEHYIDNLLQLNGINPRFKLNSNFTTVAVNINDSHPIYSSNGEPIFSLFSTSHFNNTYPQNSLRWIALLFLMFSIFSYHDRLRSFKSLIITLLGIIIIRIASIALINSLQGSYSIFSPNIYADSELFNSLGNLLLNHLFIFLGVSTLFMARKTIIKSIINSTRKHHFIKNIFFGLLPLFLIIYIHITLRSLILNSNITLEPYKIAQITGFTLLIYLSYALLFTALLFSINLLTLTLRKNKFSINKPKELIIYILLISLYTVITVSFYGYKKEFEINRIWTNKLAIERDISLELQLRSVENSIANDPLIRLLTTTQQGTELILNRLIELYLWNIVPKYNIRVTVCAKGDKLKTENYAYPVDCYSFFNSELIGKYGIPLTDLSSFYYLNNFKNKVNYIGRFNYFVNNMTMSMYVEIESKQITRTIGYPSLLINTKESDNINIPSSYSYAKYYDNKLTSVEGDYNYPIDLKIYNKSGYFSQRINGYIHFINKLSPGCYIAISRPNRTAFPYLIFYSYISLFYGLIILGILRTRIRRHMTVPAMPKRSLRKKITYLLTSSLFIALIFMGIGSVFLIINLINDYSKKQMEEKMDSVQTTISQIVKYASHYNEINTIEMYNAMDRVGLNTKVDINLYDPLGRLIRSTKPEVFDRYIFSSRMDPEAYHSLIHENKRQLIKKESIGDITYFSLYAPIFNNSGTLLAIANVPYFINNKGLQDNASSIIAAIINLYILLIIATIIGGFTLSNSLTKPLEEIGKKMEEIDFSEKTEHIVYKEKDEIGKLVVIYNKMVDDLEESTRKLAQSEREQAWREMARQIAHEIKNPLTPMKLSIQHLMRMKQQNYPNWEDKFDAVSASVIEQIDILSETANEFSSFARFYNEENSEIDIIALLKEQKILFDNRDNIKISFITTLNEAIVTVKKNQIIRAFVNLISNAIQAIENQEEGIINISIDNNNDSYIIQIEDNGPGVSYANIDKLFKPNFTTKSSGSGLGLAISRSIIYQSQGNISYKKSETLGGANFVVTIPKKMHT